MGKATGQRYFYGSLGELFFKVPVLTFEAGISQKQPGQNFLFFLSIWIECLTIAVTFLTILVRIERLKHIQLTIVDFFYFIVILNPTKKLLNAFSQPTQLELKN
jgi:hypothetical protein